MTEFRERNNRSAAKTRRLGLGFLVLCQKLKDTYKRDRERVAKKKQLVVNPIRPCRGCRKTIPGYSSYAPEPKMWFFYVGLKTNFVCGKKGPI